MNTEPTFNYPTGNEDVWVKCEKNDPQKEDYWCPNFGAWSLIGTGIGNCGHADCGQIWRKRVKVPEGWEVAPLNDSTHFSYKVLSVHGVWEPILETELPWGARISNYEPNTIFIRPIAKASEGTTVAKTFEALNEMVAKAERQANPYAVTIKGVTFDYYDFCRANGMTDQPIAHALKKLWRHGKGHKTAQQDVQDAIDSLKRWQEMEGVK